MPDVGGIAGDRLKFFIERIERLEEERRDLNADIGEVYKEAKGAGFDTKIMRMVVRERRMDKEDLDEQEALLDTYRRALGMLADLPLGKAALLKAGTSAGKTETGPVTFADKSVPPEPDKPRRLGRRKNLKEKAGDAVEELAARHPGEITVLRDAPLADLASA